MFVDGMRTKVEALAEQGLRAAEIARRLELAGPTVDYHLERIRDERTAAPRAVEDPPKARRDVSTRQRVAELLRQGVSRAEIARRLSLSKATISYHARRLGEPVDARCARRYDWQAVQQYYDRGHSVRECIAQFGFSSETWHSAVARGAVVARPAKMPAEEFFAAGVYRSRSHMKSRLLGEGLTDPRCATCSIEMWRGRPLSLALHHLNGDRMDNRVENLVLLCPNCHSQTDNFAGRNGHRRPLRTRPATPDAA